MIRRSGVTPASSWSNTARGTLRRCASGQMASRQLRKFAAAARMAEACISGWPEAPSSPVHSRGAWLGAASCGGVCVAVPGDENSERRSNCATAGATPAISAAAANPSSLRALVMFTIRPNYGRAPQLLLRLACYMDAEP